MGFRSSLGLIGSTVIFRTPFAPSSQCLGQDYRQGFVLLKVIYMLTTHLQLQAHCNVPVRVTPQELRNLAGNNVEGPADPLLEAQSFKPSGEG